MVWANTIAIVLVALSVGYSIGGRIADRDPTIHGLARIVLGAAVLLAIVPFVAGPFLHASTTAFEDLSAGIFVGSLVGVGVLIAVPVLLLGMVSPYAVRLKVDRIEDAGRVSGRLYSIGTVGSLTGTFLASLLLIPFVGSRRTFLIFALALVLVALPGLRRGRSIAVVVAVGVIGLIMLPEGLTKPQAADGKVIWERETDYQYARVVETDVGKRILELNEGQAVHSVYRPDQFLTDGYWDEMLVLPFAGANRPKRIAILGSAAGTTARSIAHYWPDVRVDAVEIDPEVTAVGRKLFDLNGANVHTHTADARPWLHSSDATFDAILVDAYRQPYIPFYLTTQEFFDLVRERLNPGGVVIVNVGHPEGSDKLERVLSATMRTKFGRDNVWRDPFDDTNSVLLGTTEPGPPARLESAAAGWPDDLAAAGLETANRLHPGLTGGTVYTDDRAPVEWLVDASLAKVAQ
ncbi:MAG: fused MFS/spermidine synthase [Aeromicrobium sp.]